MEIRKNMKTGLIAATLALAIGSMATAQDAAPPPPGGGDGPGGGIIFGKVKSVDEGAKTIRIIETRRGRTCTVHVADGAEIHAEKTVSATDLKVGDQIAVRGIPTGISASAIMDGDVREALPPPPGGPGGPDEDGPQGDGGPGRRQGPPTMASASGKITSTSPLTIAINDDVSIVIKVGSTAKVRKIVTEQLSDIKAGDRIMASGDPGDDGSLDVDKIALNVHMPPPPPGMGRRGGRGFGGPGGGGPGGFGGGQQMGENGPGGGFGGPDDRRGPGGGGQGGAGMDDSTGPDQDGPRFGRRPPPPQGGPDDNGGFGGPAGAGAPPPPDGGDQS